LNRTMIRRDICDFRALNLRFCIEYRAGK